jgi:hypothetical protein
MFTRPQLILRINKLEKNETIAKTMEKTKSKSAKSKKHKSKNRRGKKGEKRKVKKGKNGEPMDLSICMFFAFLICFLFAFISHLVCFLPGKKQNKMGNKSKTKKHI